MKLRILALVALLPLGGCLSDPATWTEADWAAYNQMQARAQGQAAQTQALIGAVIANNPAPPVIGSYTQPNGTVVYYCKDLSGHVTACKQLN